MPTAVLVACAMIAFAANSLLCRIALSNDTIDPTSFTVIRLASGAIMLVILSCLSRVNSMVSFQYKRVISGLRNNANYVSGFCLFVYAACFSYAYISMSTGAGALLLFGAVQLTMISVGLFSGERFDLFQWLGFALAIVGIVTLLLPSALSPSYGAGALMVAAGIAWGVYSLMGKKSVSALLATSGNFIYASILCIPLLVLINTTLLHDNVITIKGVLCALGSGIVASACGYAMWYRVLPNINSTTAATVQLSVPVIATLMGWALLNEALSAQIIFASVLTLGGIFLVVRR